MARFSGKKVSIIPYIVVFMVKECFVAVGANTLRERSELTQLLKMLVNYI